MKNEIKITIKFFSGLDKDLSLENYDSGKGIVLNVKEGTRLRRILKKFGLKKMSQYSYFLNTLNIGVWKKLSDGDEVSCLKRAGGG